MKGFFVNLWCVSSQINIKSFIPNKGVFHPSAFKTWVVHERWSKPTYGKWLGNPSPLSMHSWENRQIANWRVFSLPSSSGWIYRLCFSLSMPWFSRRRWWWSLMPWCKNNMAKAEINGELYKERGGSWWVVFGDLLSLSESSWDTP